METLRQSGAVVLGLGFSGVGAVHSLWDMKPRANPIVGIDSNRKELGLTSRCGKMMLGPPPWEDDGKPLCQFLLDIQRKAGCPLVLYPCGDDYVQFLSHWQDELRVGFLFLMPERACLERLMNKAAFADLANKTGVPCPLCEIVEAVPGRALPPGLRFPVIAKSVTSLKSDPFWGVLRVKQFNRREEWERFAANYGGENRQLIVQEVIEGDDSCQYVYEGLWNRVGQEVRSFTAQKLRQQPRTFGSSCRAVCRFEPEVLEKSRRLLSAVGYRGLVDIDFKRDKRDGKLWAMEVNPRLGGLHLVGRSCGVALVQDQYRMLTGGDLSSVSPIEGTHGHWCHFSKDMRGLLPELPRRPLLLFPWIWSYRQLPVDALFKWSDPWPWLGSMLRLTRAVFRELTLKRSGHRSEADGMLKTREE